MAKFLATTLSLLRLNVDEDLPLRRTAASLRRSLRDLLCVIRRLDNPHFREQACLRMRCQLCETRQLAQGKLVFESTETWRTVYEEVLKSCTVKRYLSVALVRTEDYWRNRPGDHSILLNTQLVHDGYEVQRVLIIDDFLWPPRAILPSRDVHAWIRGQFNSGIQIGLVRISELAGEDDLLVDFGIYGDSCVGYQITDEQGQTVRYEMTFGPDQVLLALDRWKRLLLYARPLESL